MKIVKMNKVINQHGDLLLVEISSIPDGAKKVVIENGYVLERGEGVHTHCIEDVSGVSIYEKDGEIYVKVDIQALLTHEEHGRQIVKPGIYKKRIERVWDYETLEARRTVD